MKQRFTIALLTIVLVAAGYLVGVWTTQSRCKVPPPPPSLLGELSPRAGKGATASKPKPTAPAPDPAWLAAEIERLRPQIDEFRARMDATDKEMDRRIDAILRPDQRAAFLELVKGGERYRARERAESELATKLTPEEIRELRQRPLQRLLAIVVVPLRVHWNTKQLKLDETQQAQLTEILRWRRDQFIALIDQSPPPSLELSTLAPMVQRLGDTEKK